MAVQVPDDVAEFMKWLTGEEFPGTDPDKLRALAQAHHVAADGVDEVLPLFVGAVNSIADGVRGESESAFVAAMRDYVSDDGYLVVASKYVRRLGAGLEDSATQVEYTQLMVMLTLIELMIELAVALAIAWFYPGVLQKVVLWLQVGRLKIAAWLARLIVAVGVSQVVGVGMQVFMDVIAQAHLVRTGRQRGWNTALTRNSAAVGAWTGMVGVLLLGAGGGAAAALLGRSLKGAAGETAGSGAAAAVKGAGESGGGHGLSAFGRNVTHEATTEVVGEGTYSGIVTGQGWKFSTVPVTAVSGGSGTYTRNVRAGIRLGDSKGANCFA